MDDLDFLLIAIQKCLSLVINIVGNDKKEAYLAFWIAALTFWGRIARLTSGPDYENN